MWQCAAGFYHPMGTTCSGHVSAPDGDTFNPSTIGMGVAASGGIWVCQYGTRHMLGVPCFCVPSTFGASWVCSFGRTHTAGQPCNCSLYDRLVGLPPEPPPFILIPDGTRVEWLDGGGWIGTVIGRVGTLYKVRFDDPLVNLPFASGGPENEEPYRIVAGHELRGYLSVEPGVSEEELEDLVSEALLDGVIDAGV